MTNSSGTIRRFALIGQPVAHSRSPQIHAAFAGQLADEISYQLIECGSDEVEDTVRGFFAEGGHGMNVTLPHKAAVMACCDSLSDDAELAQAVNTLVPRPEGGLRGENTDGAGCVRDLRRLGIEVSGRRIAVLGAGGAARGIIKPLLDAGPAELVWSNRNPLRLEGQEERYTGPLRCCANMALKGDRFDLVINATAAGHQGKAPLLPHALFAPGGAAYDLTYGEAARPFLDWARSEGAAAAHTGAGMLVEQAALSYWLWTGQMPDTVPVHTIP